MIVCELPGVHEKVCGAVSDAPSTVIDNPGGLVVTVTDCGAATKVPVTLRAALIVTDVGFVEPLASPDQAENCCPVFGLAVNCTAVPLL